MPTGMSESQKPEERRNPGKKDRDEEKTGEAVEKGVKDTGSDLPALQKIEGRDEQHHE